MKRSLQFPFNENGISSLLFLEESYEKNSNEQKIVSQLVEKYAALIEYYDSKKDPIKLYFMDKMQATVFNYNKSKEKVEADDYFEKINELNIQKKYKNKKRSSNLFKPMKKYEKEISNGKQLFDIRKAKREREHFLYSKYQKENQNEDKKLKNKITEFNKKSENNTKLIKSHLNKQKDSIKSKLRQRRERSMERSMSRGRSNRSFAKLGGSKNNLDRVSNRNILKSLNSIDNEYYG